MASFATVPDEVAAPLQVNVKEAALEARKKVVQVVYNTYADSFTTDDSGILTAKAIDEEYCLSDAMPGCTIHLTSVSSAEFTRKAQADPLYEYPLEREEPLGTFNSLCDGVTYHVVVVEDAAQQELDREKMVGQKAKLEERSEEADANAKAADTSAVGQGISEFDKKYSEYESLDGVWGEKPDEIEEPAAAPPGVGEDNGDAPAGWK